MLYPKQWISASTACRGLIKERPTLERSCDLNGFSDASSFALVVKLRKWQALTSRDKPIGVCVLYTLEIEERWALTYCYNKDGQIISPVRARVPEI